jgi:hypothetical protein
MQPKNLNYLDSVELEASHVIKAGPGSLFLVTGISTNVGTQYIQVHDSATLPANGAVPAIVLVVAAGEGFSYDLREIGRFFKKGIVVCNSSTLPTKTIGAADCWFSAQYI